MGKIIELAFIRNQLLSENIDNSLVFNMIEKVKHQLEESLENNMICFMLEIIKLAEEEIIKKKYKNAAYDIGLIHNFPLDKMDTWKEEYFYKFDFVGYYDYLIEQKQLKKLKTVICLMNKYLIDCSVHNVGVKRELGA